MPAIMLEGFRTGLSGTHLQVDKVKFVAQVGMGVMEILADAQQGLVEGESSFHADHSEI